MADFGSLSPGFTRGDTITAITTSPYSPTELSLKSKAVMAKMKEMPINDFMTRNGRIREDGRVIRDMYLMQAKTPDESKSEWDLAKIIATIPGEQAFRPLAEGGCPLVKK